MHSAVTVQQEAEKKEKAKKGGGSKNSKFGGWCLPPIVVRSR